MGLLRRAIRSAVAAEVRDGLENPSVPLVEALTTDWDGVSTRTASGVSITPDSSLRLTAVWSAVRILSEGVSTLPFPVYKRTDNGRERVPGDPRYPLLNELPNPEMTAVELWEMVMGHLNLWGNGYVYRFEDPRGRESLWPLNPKATKPFRQENGAKAYTTILPNGQPVNLRPDQVIHYRGFTTWGDEGLSPIRQTRQALGAALAAEEYGSRFFANDARPGVVIIGQTSFKTDDQEKEFRRKWEAGHRGLSKSHLLGVLTNAEIKTVGIPPGDAQFIETRKFGVREIARIFRVPPYMLADLEAGSVSYASVEQQSIDFVVHNLRPWLVRIEQRTKAGLFLTKSDARDKVYPEFLVDGLLRGDTKTRYEAYAIGIQNGWLSPNDVRELENLPKIPGGDTYRTPIKAGKQPAPVSEDEINAAPLSPDGKRVLRWLLVSREADRLHEQDLLELATGNGSH